MTSQSVTRQYSWGRRGGALLATLVMALVLPGGSHVAASPSEAAIDGAYAVFTEPVDGEDTAVEDELVKLIDKTPKGAEIHGAMYSWTRTPVAEALRDAQQRGVSVSLAVDWEGHEGVNKDSSAVKTLKDANLTELVLCNQGDENSSACISPREKSINHNKTFTFSETGDLKNVVLASSHNLTGSQIEMFNDAVVIPGDKQLYDGFVAYLTALRAEKKNDDFFNTPEGQVASSSGEVEGKFSPRADSDGGHGVDPKTDTVANILTEVTEGENCSVDLAHAQFRDTRAAVAEELIRLAEAGCEVRVTNDERDAEITELFEGTPVDVRSNPDLHSKYMVINGTVGGEAGRSLVVAGSHNLNGYSLRTHDETLIKMELDSVVSAYTKNFDVVWDNSTTA